VSFATRSTFFIVREFSLSGVSRQSGYVVWLSFSTESYTIEVDIPRTCPDHPLFSNSSEFEARYPDWQYDKNMSGVGAEALERILTAYALRNGKIGYVQGMNFLAAMLLLITGDEVKTFWLFATMLEDMLPGYFGKRLKGFQVDSIVMQKCLQEHLGPVCDVLQLHKLPIDFVIPKWFLCLFFNTFEPYQVAHVWDTLFFDPKTDSKTTIIKIGMGIMHHKSQSIKDASAEDDITRLSSAVQSTDDCRKHCDDILRLAFVHYASITEEKVNELRASAHEHIRTRTEARKIHLAKMAAARTENEAQDTVGTKRKAEDITSATDSTTIETSPIPADSESQFDQFHRRIGIENPRMSAKKTPRSSGLPAGFLVDGASAFSPVQLNSTPVSPCNLSCSLMSLCRLGIELEHEDG